MTRIALLLLFAISASSPAAEKKRFGRPLQGWPIATLESVLASPQNGQRVHLEGRIEKVCQQKGCWLRLTDGERSVLVTFRVMPSSSPRDRPGRTSPSRAS